MTIRRFAASAALGALVVAFAAPAAFAQQTSASLRGVATDDVGAPIAGATITVVHTPSGTKSTVVTDGAGVFDARGLRVGGPYKVSGKAANFVDQNLSDIYLTVGDAGRVSLTFVPADQVAAVTVKGKKKSNADLANVGSRTTLRAADIDEVVSVRRDIRDVARRDPLAQLDLVSRSTGPTGGLSIAGSSPRRNRITIDGVRSQDDYGLNTGGFSTNRGPISLDAIEQVAVQATPFDVEDGDFTGGAINMIMKSGGNDFHGSFFDFYRTPRLIGKWLPAVTTATDSVGNMSQVKTLSRLKPYVHDQNYGFFLSGPILQDRLFFAVSYEKYSSFDTTAAGPSGSGFGVSYANILQQPAAGLTAANPGIPSTLTNLATNIGGAWSNYAASSRLPLRGFTLFQPVLDEKASIKLDYNISDNQRLSVAYRRAASSNWKSRGSKSTTIVDNTDTYLNDEKEDNYSVQLNSKWDALLSTEARLAFRSYERGQVPPEGQGYSQVSVCTDLTSSGTTTSCGAGPTVLFGPDGPRQANVLKTNDLSGSFTANYRLFDTHQVKLGYQYKGIHIFNLFVQNAHGAYYFDSLADFNAGIASKLSYGSAITNNPMDTAAVLSYAVNTLFAQDTFDVTPNFTVNYGLRYDRYSSDKVPALNTNYVTRYGIPNTGTYDGKDILMPRASAKWKTEWFQLSGGIGLVSGGIPDVLLGNSYGNQTGATSNAFTVQRNADGTFTNTSTNSPVDAVTGAALLNINKADPNWISTQSPTAQSLISADSVTRRTAYTNVIPKSFDLPSDWKANLSFKTTQLGWDLGVDAVYTVSENNVAFRDRRARLLTGADGKPLLTPDGRLRYDGLAVDAVTRASLSLPVASNTDLTNLGSGDIEVYNPSQSSWNQTVAFSASRSWKNFDIFGAYITQNAKSYGGISEFGTTEGGSGPPGNFLSDQNFGLDPNASVSGRPSNFVKEAYKLSATYNVELLKGYKSSFSLFMDSHSGRPITFIMSESSVGTRGGVFGVGRNDGLAYVPNLSNPVAVANPNVRGSTASVNPAYLVTTGNTSVYFENLKTFNQFKSLVTQFNLPQGKIVPKGFGTNPWVGRIDFQYAQEIPGPVAGHTIQLTMNITNLGNLLNKKWGTVKEYSDTRTGTTIANVDCASAAGVLSSYSSAVTVQPLSGKNPGAAYAGPATCGAYYYSYASGTTPTDAMKPATIDSQASLWQVEVGLKYKF